MAARWLIKGGKVIDTEARTEAVSDVLIEGDKIKEIGKNLSSSSSKVIDAKGKVVAPGFIDMHVHLREPGREDEETIETGTKAAIKGGFTALCCMPNTAPPIDNSSVAEFVLKEASKVNLASVYPVGAATKGLKGEELSEMAELAEAGVIAFSDDGNSILNSRVARRVMEYLKMLDLPLIIHAEDKNLSLDGQMHEGYYSTLLGLKGIPSEAEEVMIARDIFLAGLTGARIHFAHVSTKGSVELIKEAKRRGLKVTAEVTPHHLVLTDAELVTFDTNLKVNPPLRSKEDVEALRKALAEGVIDAIATDHAPHATFEKEKEFIYAPFGMIGLETAFPLVYTELVETKKLSLVDAVLKFTLGPASILNLSKGKIAQGAVADIVIFNPEAEFVVDAESFESKSKNSPFVGRKLKGKIEYVFKGGRLVLKDGKIRESN